MIRHLSIPRAILATLYLLQLVYGLFIFFAASGGLLQLAMLTLIAITLHALVARPGDWRRIVGMFVGYLYAVFGLAALVVTFTSEASGIENVLGGIVGSGLLLVFGLSTGRFLKRDAPAASDDRTPFMQ